jgi:lipoprotein NlpI
MAKMSVWDLIEENRFDEACELADHEHATTQSLFPLRNKVLALLNLERYDEVVTLCEFLIDRGKQASSDGDFIAQGVAYWLSGRLGEAVESWQRGRTAGYNDAAGGVEIPLLLYFASVKRADAGLEKQAMRNLKSTLQSNRTVNWPGPLAVFSLHRITEGELLTKVSAQPFLMERQSCQADFWIAVKMLKQGDINRYLKKLTECISYWPTIYLEVEYYLAKGEIARASQTTQYLQ